MKNPWFLAILNFVTIGGATVLLGRRRLVGLLYLLGGGVLLRYEELRIAPAWTGHVTVHWLIAFFGMGALGVAAALDAVAESRQLR